ncbi:hypothetical protein MAPG_03225 [Magnaporthiopsis poae ATCC 64411]|uniref:Beta-xylosidase n=1 Tax=Magnaporthiopsis poae (strain ATCC 64411 / 73-15) TaxID=644358 RepID=A0A0C4DTF8_MAGP6|nr:hypothetical protein MAPG_03225 [Magnaporthiopsis poae ATCC 64411]
MYHGHNHQRPCKSTDHQRQPSSSSQPSSPVDAAPPQDASGTAASTPTAPTTTITTHSSSLSARRSARSPEFERKLEQMALPLAPLVQMTTGDVHPAFPSTLLHYWLLTDDQLESLAHFYHQRTPSVWTGQYPCPVRWRAGLTLEEKRRKMGRFIGLRGCESPTTNADTDIVLAESAEDLVDEARRRAVLEDDGDEALKRKFGFYH